MSIKQYFRTIGAAAAISSFIFSTAAMGQDLVAVIDISGGSSVFVLRGGGRPAPRKFAAKISTARTKTQRTESARKLSRQYITLAKEAPRRQRSQVLDPNALKVNIKTMSPDKASVLFAGVGEYWMDRDQFDQSIDLFREALMLDAKNQRAQGGLSEALALKGNELLVRDTPAVARKFFEEALSYNKNNAPAYFGLAEVFNDLGDEDAAATNYEKALSTDKELTEIYSPLGVLYYQKGEIAKADDLLTLAAKGENADARTVFYFGLVRFVQNKNAEAAAAFKRALAIDPTMPEPYYYLGETLVRDQKFADAVSSYKKAVELKPQYFDAWLALGAAQYTSGDYAGAATSYKEATRLNNTSIEAYENLGDAYRQAGNYKDSEAAYNLAVLFVERQPNVNREQAADIYSKATYMIAKQCELNRTQGIKCRWDVAIKNLEKAAQLNPTDLDTANLGWAYFNAARTDLKFGLKDQARPKFEKAREYLQKATAKDSNFVAGPLLNLGMVDNELGDHTAAAAALKRVVAKEPNWAAAQNELGYAYIKLNQPKDAVAVLKKAVAADATMSLAWYNLGEAQYRARDNDYKKTLERLKKLDPGMGERLQRETAGIVLK